MDYATFYQEMNEHYYRAGCYHTMKDPDNDATSGNHHVINATYHLISKTLDNNYDWKKGLEDEIKFNQFVWKTELIPGLYGRHPDKRDNPQTHDDYIGIVVSDKVFNRGYTGMFHRHIYNYGRKRWWYYDNLQKPVNFTTKWNYWHGRFPGVIGVYKRAAGEQVGILDRAAFCVGIFWEMFFNKDKSDTSGKILQWLQNSVMKGESKMVDYCINRWENWIKEQYPGQMGEVLGIYHGKEHPFSKAMWGKM